MWIDRLPMAVLCGFVAAISFSVAGALFGAWARLVGYWFDKVPEATMSRAAIKGLWSGGLFLAAVGFVYGAVLGGIELPGSTILRVLGTTILFLLLLVVGVSVAGGVAFGLERLGSLTSGLGIALAVTGLFFAAPIRTRILHKLSAAESEASPFDHLLIWGLSLFASFAILALLLCLIFLLRLVFAGAWHLLAAKKNQPAIEKSA